MVSPEFLARVEQLPLVWSNEPGSFARLGFTHRYPALVRDCVELNGARFSSKQRERLLQLAQELEHDAEFPLPSTLNVEPGATTAEWEKMLTGKGYRWHNAPWFLAGMYMFHHILLIADYYTTGVDPFHASKVTELEQEPPWRLLQAAVGLSAQEEAASVSRRDQLKQFMKRSRWGNKADECYKEVKDTVSGDDASLVFDDKLLLVDHSAKTISYLEKKATELGNAKTVGVAYINDNSDTAGFGARRSPVDSRVMRQGDNEREDGAHSKMRAREVQALGTRLAGYVQTEQLVVRPDIFWNRYKFYWEMPTELQSRLADEATLVIIKGDLNYRRLLGDRLWAPSTPINEVVPYFPAAYVSFRTMKSTLVAGVPDRSEA
ncbi:hypothetical protein PHYPSEUDO_001687 [Phytophthora pseudosyringae]|uniref:Sugar phosphate phosphatase n=1 Tax=Phytophthora pseudosyringae TaxID=221518 RepID=A0A8T1V702_9STRA|nr:hypothetical protein PHYPSEUDO_001687 [Phytophthora pseudosyringae]